MKKHSHMKWSWILMIIFFVLSMINLKFGVLGFVCMAAPILSVLQGKGKSHCSKHCPRGSLLGKFLKKISMNQSAPKFMLTRKFKNGLLIFMIVSFMMAMLQTKGEFVQIAFAVFKFMAVSSVVALVMGVIFKPRSWCGVCPMGHGTVLIDQEMKKRKPRIVFNSK